MPFTELHELCLVQRVLEDLGCELAIEEIEALPVYLGRRFGVRTVAEGGQIVLRESEVS